MMCKICREPNQKCIDICDNYEHVKCLKLIKSPYVCNGCGKRVCCLLDKKIYSLKYADDCYHQTLISSREGINQTPENIQKIDALVSPLIQKGQSIAHIYANHAEEIQCSRRKKATQISIIEREFRKDEIMMISKNS